MNSEYEEMYAWEADEEAIQEEQMSELRNLERRNL